MASTQQSTARNELVTLVSQGGVVEITQHWPQDDGSERVSKREYRRGDRIPRELHDPEVVILRDQQGRLTRAGMERVLEEGGSVLYGGNIIDNADDLPDEVELAGADEQQLDNLKRQNEQHIEYLQRQIKQMEAAQAVAQRQQSSPSATQQRPEAGSQQQKEQEKREQEQARQAEQQKHAEQQRQAQQEQRKGK